MNVRRVCLLTRHALSEAAHLRLAWMLVLAALALVAGASVLREFNFGQEEARFFQDLTQGTLMLFGTAQAILLTVTLVLGGLERGLPGLLFTRGVRRAEWLVACLLATWVSLAWLSLAVHVVLGLLLAGHGHPVALAELFRAGGAGLLRLGLVACFALAMCTVTRSPLLATTLSLALTFAAQLAPVIAWAGSHGRPAARPIWIGLERLLPNFATIEPGPGFAWSFVYATGYAVLYTALACLVFARREL
jgi:ABC-type transport system involved in multi-copper enzyme maturation permease subunit